MTGRWAGYGLHVDLGDPARPWVPRTAWLRPPSADYRCPCGWSDSAAGDAVPAFVATARAEHTLRCPLPPPRDGPAPPTTPPRPE